MTTIANGTITKYTGERPHGPTIFNQWRNEGITTEDAMSILGMTKDTWDTYVDKMSQWCRNALVYQDCCNYIDRISSDDFKVCLAQTSLSYSEDELVEESIFGITSIINQAYKLLTTKEANPMINTKNTLQSDIRWADKNYVYAECLKYLEENGRTDLANDIGYVIADYTKRQLVKVSVNGFKYLAEEAKRLQRVTQENLRYRTRS